MRSSSLRVFAYVETELPAMGKCVEPDSGPLARRQTSPPMWTSEKTITKKPNKKLTVRSAQPQMVFGTTHRPVQEGVSVRGRQLVKLLCQSDGGERSTAT